LDEERTSLQNNTSITYLKKNNLVRITLFVLLIFWCAGFISPLMLHENYFNTLPIRLLNHNYSLVCHQSIEKTLSFNDNNFLVCARCTGIYSGALAASLIFILFPVAFFRNLIPLFIASLVLLLDVVFINIGIYSYSKETAFLTGILFGAIVYIYILEVLELFIYSIQSKRANEQ
jgi:uncharacterized membrane protein